MSSYAVDTNMWGKWINNSAESVDWMCDIMNAKGLKTSLEFGYDDPDGFTTEIASSHTFWNEKYPNGALTGAGLQAKAYADTIIEMGGTIHYSTKAEQLVRENNNTGRVSAVIAKDPNGNYVKFAAEKAVVLATGDFSKDRDMMAKYSPMIYKMFENIIDWDKKVNYDASFVFNGIYPGDGHKMGLWVGAAWQKTHPNAAIFHTDFRVPFPSVAGHAAFWGVNMDIRGKRFMNENCNILLLMWPR
jgi:succinate dehydrogenase/fumarate reductase flavoprotein subunit